MASKYSWFVQTPCAKTPEFGEAEFWDCTPVSCCTNALCQNCKKLRFLRLYAGFRLGVIFAYGTGNLIAEFSSAEFGALARGFW